MHRYEELNRLYYKKLILKFFIFTGIAILFVAGFFILNIEKNTNKNIQKIKKEKKINSFKNNSVKKEKKREKKTVNNGDKEVKSFHFILPDFSKVNSLPLENKTKTDNKSHQNRKKIKAMKEIQIKHSANLDIKIEEKKANLKTLIKKFNQTKDFDLAILIAKEYFKKGDLQNAQIWALKANNINPASYKSWILFADILLKKKKTKKVREILKVYLDSYGQNDIIEEKLRSLNDK